MVEPKNIPIPVPTRWLVELYTSLFAIDNQVNPKQIYIQLKKNTLKYILEFDSRRPQNKRKGHKRAVWMSGLT